MSDSEGLIILACRWTCPDCQGQCGINFATAEDVEMALTVGVTVDHEDFHQACDVAPEYGGTD